MHAIAPTTIRPDPRTKIQTNAPLVQKSWDRHQPQFRQLSPLPKFATLGGSLDVRI